MLTNPQSELSGHVARAFTNPSLGTIRIAGTPEHPLICFIDLVRLLGTTETTVRSKVAKEDKVNLTVATKGGLQYLSFITPLGFQNVVSRSRNPKAVLIESWVYHVVLPAFRSEMQDLVADIPVEQPVTLPVESSPKKDDLESLVMACIKKFMSQYLDKGAEVKAAPETKEVTYSLEAIANELGVDKYALFMMMKRHRVFRKCCDYFPFANFREGYFVRPTIDRPVSGANEVLVTQKGRELIHRVYDIFGVTIY